jgi:hypothetical protein
VKQVVIENPVINSPFKESNRHFRFTEEGITDEIVETRRVSAYFIPITRPKKKAKRIQLSFDTEWTQDRVRENEQINKIRNDEAHHCYRRRAVEEDIKLTGDERKEAEKREEEARIWISGLEAVKAKIGVKVIYDLSATPFFLRGSGYPEGTLFPWVVSDFSLIDAIESGIVKVPRVPVADDSMTGDQPTYRDLWLQIRGDLQKKGRLTNALSGEPALPAPLEGALQALYGNYEKYYRLADCVILKDNTFPQLLLLIEYTHSAADLIYQSIVRSEEGEKAIKPILRPYDTIGTTRYVKFDTTRPVYSTNPTKCHISHVVADTGSWEQKKATRSFTEKYILK